MRKWLLPESIEDVLPDEAARLEALRRTLLDHFADHGVDIGDAPQWPKGCTWVLDTDAAGEVRRAHYLPPPPG